MAQKVGEITEKQSQIRELNIDKQKLENDLSETQNFNKQLKTKLEESLKSLESNANMITWLNKQLNEKQSSAASGLYGGITSKPPMGSTSQMSSTSFKPSIATIDQMGQNKGQSSFN